MYERILVAVDGSPTSDRALANALTLARTFRSQVRVVHVLEAMAYLSGFDADSGLAMAVRQAGDDLVARSLDQLRLEDISCDAMLYDRLGPLGETVAHAAKLWNADLVIVGTHGRKGLTRLLMGSGAEQIIRLSPVPVLVVRDSTLE